MNEELSLKSDRNFYILYIILGILVNFIVFSANGYQMPVKSQEMYLDNTHFTYQDNSEVKLWWGTDILHIPNNYIYFYFSFGDLIFVTGFILLVINHFRLVTLK